MNETRVSENVSRLCLTAVLILVFLAWGTASANAPALDHQFDGPGSHQAVLLDSSGDSPSTELGLASTAHPGIPLTTGHLVYSPSLTFIEPPVRFLSYPNVPQGPPFLS